MKKSICETIISGLLVFPILTGCFETTTSKSLPVTSLNREETESLSGAGYPQVALFHENGRGSQTTFSSWDAAHSDQPTGELRIRENGVDMELSYKFIDQKEGGDIYDLKRHIFVEKQSDQVVTNRVVFDGQPVIVFDDAYGKTSLIKKASDPKSKSL